MWIQSTIAHQDLSIELSPDGVRLADYHFCWEDSLFSEFLVGIPRKRDALPNLGQM